MTTLFVEQETVLKSVEGATLNLTPGAEHGDYAKMVGVNFTLEKDEMWEDWGTMRTVFRAQQRMKIEDENSRLGYRFVDSPVKEVYFGTAAVDSEGNIIYISASSPIYNVGDSIDLHNVHSCKVVSFIHNNKG